MNETSSYLQTVGRALEILELIGRFPGLTLSELARRTGMNTTVIYRLLFTLSTVGFLQQEPGGKRYYLGDKTLLLGVQSLDNREIKRIAQYYMWDHYERTGDTCILTVPCAGRASALKKSAPFETAPALYVRGVSILCTRAPPTGCCWLFSPLESSSATWMTWGWTRTAGSSSRRSWTPLSSEDMISVWDC